jgi:hypothetical protein
MGRQPQAKVALESFEEELDSAEKLIKAVKPLVNPLLSTGASPPILVPKQAERVIGLAFLGVVAAWDEFLQEAFSRYMAGATSPSSFAPSLRLGKCDTIDHAIDVLATEHEFDLEKGYLTWSSFPSVQSRAKVFFRDGLPFCDARISPVHVEHLSCAQKVRNRVAHKSDKCVAEFLKVYAKLTNTPSGSGNQGADASRLLLAKPVGWLASKSTDSVAEAFLATYRELSKVIVPP